MAIRWDWDSAAHQRAHAICKRLSLFYLDHGYYVITANRAGRLCKAFNGLPRHGYERRIGIDGLDFWIARTRHQNETVWTVRPVN